jgi:hypothetical protein
MNACSEAWHHANAMLICTDVMMQLLQQQSHTFALHQTLKAVILCLVTGIDGHI